MDLIGFLRKQLDNDEAFAHGWHGGGAEYIGSGFPADPARMLIEVDAKRATLEWLELTGDPEFPAAAWVIAKHVLTAMARPYAAHPDFDLAWLVPVLA